MVRDLAAARESQIRSKLQLQAEVAQVERAEFDRVLAVNRQREAELAAQVGWRALLGLPVRSGLGLALDSGRKFIGWDTSSNQTANRFAVSFSLHQPPTSKG